MARERTDPTTTGTPADTIEVSGRTTSVEQSRAPARRPSTRPAGGTAGRPSGGTAGGTAGAPVGARAASPIPAEAAPAHLRPIRTDDQSGGDGAQHVLRDPRRSDVDEWGRSEHMRSIARRIYDPLYRHWFRAEWEGLEKIPATGGALLVANHAGAIPSDAPVIMHGIEEELGRPVYGMADYFFRTVPVVGTLWSRTGGVPAHPDNAYRILHDQQQLALVFPEGAKGPSKTYSDRYRLRRFGRGGFVEIAMRSGVPVVPLAVVGAEESMPVLFRLPSVAKALGVPYFPVTANLLMFGPLVGPVAYFPAKFKIRVLDPVRFDVLDSQERYSKSRVMDEAERIRSRIQDALHDMLRERRSVWFG